MITPPDGWRMSCDSEDCESFEELNTDDFDYEDVRDIDSEDAFMEFAERQGWTERDGEHFCPECSERMKHGNI